MFVFVFVNVCICICKCKRRFYIDLTREVEQSDIKRDYINSHILNENHNVYTKTEDYPLYI